MAKALNDKNRLALGVVLFVNLALLYAAIKSDAILVSDWAAVTKGIDQALPAGFLLILVGILNAQLSPRAKTRIAFLRWKNALPGCEAFSRHANDERVDRAALERAHGPLPTEPDQQNQLWYKLYKSVENQPSIQHVQRDYLFTRDYACLALLAVPILGVAGFVQIPSPTTKWSYLLLLVAQFLVVQRAARNNGRAFVADVLALKSAEPNGVSGSG